MSLGSMLYPKALISEISRKDQEGEVQIKTFSLPFVLPSSGTDYKLGDLVIDSPNDVTKILTDFDGDVSRFPGHMALHAEGKYTNLLINVNEKAKEEIMDNDLLLETLKPGQVHSRNLLLKNKKKSSDMDDSSNLKTLKMKRRKHKKSK